MKMYKSTYAYFISNHGWGVRMEHTSRPDPVKSFIKPHSSAPKFMGVFGPLIAIEVR